MVSTLYNMLKDFGLGNLAAVIVIISLFVDLTPSIKLNPLKWIFNQFGTAFNHSVDKKIDAFRDEMNEKINKMECQLNSRMDSLEKQIEKIDDRQDEQNKMLKQQARDIDIAEIDRLKSSILDFSNRLSQGQKFTAEEYHTVMDRYTQYENIIAKYEDLSNGKIDIEYNIIVDHYTKHKDCGEFMF